MNSAVITPCSHFFHAGCLKKWLYVQETCPLCHSQLKSQTPTAPAPNQDTPAANQSAEAAAKKEEKNGAPLADEKDGAGDGGYILSAGETSSPQHLKTSPSSSCSSPPSLVTGSPDSYPSSSSSSPPGTLNASPTPSGPHSLSSQALVQRRIPAESSVSPSSKPDRLPSTSEKQCPPRCL